MAAVKNRRSKYPLRYFKFPFAIKLWLLYWNFCTFHLGDSFLNNAKCLPAKRLLLIIAYFLEFKLNQWNYANLFIKPSAHSFGLGRFWNSNTQNRRYSCIFGIERFCSFCPQKHTIQLLCFEKVSGVLGTGRSVIFWQITCRTGVVVCVFQASRGKREASAECESHTTEGARKNILLLLNRNANSEGCSKRMRSILN